MPYGHHFISVLRLPGCCMHADGGAGNITGALAANWGDIPVVLRNKPWPALQRTGDQLAAGCSLSFLAVAVAHGCHDCFPSRYAPSLPQAAAQAASATKAHLEHQPLLCLEHRKLFPKHVENVRIVGAELLCALQAASCSSMEEHLALLGWRSQEWTAWQKASEVHACCVSGGAIAAFKGPPRCMHVAHSPTGGQRCSPSAACCGAIHAGLCQPRAACNRICSPDLGS